MTMLKKVFVTSIAFILILSMYINPVFASEYENVYINGKPLAVQAVLEDTAMIPAEEFLKALGASFSYDHSKMTASIQKDNIFVDLALDNPEVLINGTKKTMPAPMKIIGRRLMIPMKFMASVFKEAAYWDPFRNRWIVLKKDNTDVYYWVESGDTLWKLSVTFETTVDDLMKKNNLSSTMLWVGQKLKTASGVTGISAGPCIVYTKTSATLFSEKSLTASAKGYLKAWTGVTAVEKTGVWYKADTPRGRGYLHQSVIYTQDLIKSGSTYFNRTIPVDHSKDKTSYSNYTVKSGDTLWTVATGNGISVYELAAVNDLSTTAWLSIGQVLKIPRQTVVAEDPVQPGYGKLADWFTQGTYILPINKKATVIDIETGKSFQIQRTTGVNHADVETLTAADTKIMKEIFSGQWSWNKKAVYLEVDGTRYAASIAGMPHAGLDSQPYLVDVSGRSDNWGYGPNYDAVKGNNMDGHFDLYFLNGITHKNNQLDSSHQRDVLKAAGLH